MTKLIEPHGGELKELMAAPEQAEEIRDGLHSMPVWDLTQRQVLDIELLLNGAFSPLEGFLDKADYEGVCRRMRLESGLLWPIPITLDVTEEFASALQEGGSLALRHPEGMVVATMKIEDIWRPDLDEEAELVYGTGDEKHPAVHYLRHLSNPVYVGGPIVGLTPPPHHTYVELRHTPRQLRRIFSERAWERIVAFQTRNPMHRAHVELTRRAMKKADANLLIHPVVGLTKPGDVDYFSRVRCYLAVLNNYPEKRSVMLNLLPLAMRMGGPREAVWHAIIRRNYGCTHFIVGRDHAGPGTDSSGKPFYDPYAAQELVRRYQDELLIEMVDFEEMVYVEDLDEYRARSEVPEGARVLTLSGTELRRRLREGLDIPSWFSYPEVIEELRRTHPPRSRQGFTVLLVGRVGSGKSTVANILTAKLLEYGTRNVTLLDSEAIDTYIMDSPPRTREESLTLMRRLAFVASEISKNRGVAVCAPLAPYEQPRRRMRELVVSNGAGFIEVHLDASEEICRDRDRKGIYRAVDRGEVGEFAGVTDPFEPPREPELTINTEESSAEEAARKIILHLEHEGYLATKP